MKKQSSVVSRQSLAKTKEQKRRYRAIRKAVQTRAANRAWKERWEKLDKPALENYTRLWNHLLQKCPVRVVLSELGHEQLQLRLKGKVTSGSLIAMKHWGRTVTVLVDGYKNPRDYSFVFWEPVLPVLSNA